MKINDIVTVESSAEFAWMRMPEEARRKVGDMLKNLSSEKPIVGDLISQRGELDTDHFRIIYEGAKDGGMTVLAVATEREARILRK